MEENDVLNELNVQPEIGNLEDYELWIKER